MEKIKEIILKKIKEQVTPVAFIIWFSDLDFVLEDGILEIKSPNQFKSNIVKNEFSDMLKDIMSEMLSENIKLKFTYQ